MLKKVLLGLVVVIVIFLIVVATRPATYHVSRATTVAAPAALVFPWVADFRKFGQWSPWDKRDPAMTKTYEGPEIGVGSKYKWSGNDQVGTGSMTVIAIVPDQKVDMALEFIAPWESKATTGFLLAADGDGTKVTWSMDGNNDFMGKMMSLFMDMDAMIGKDYEEGLAALKVSVEKSAAEMAAKAEETEAAAADDETPAAEKTNP